MQCQVRVAQEADASQVSRVILAALFTSNARDYPPAVIERVKGSFTPAAVLQLMQHRRMFVALMEGAVVGTASLDGGAVRSVFVDPQRQGRGIGRQLMIAVEQAAREAGESLLRVPSSITAEGFYASLGYRTLREQIDGQERTLIMERDLNP